MAYKAAVEMTGPDNVTGSCIFHFLATATLTQTEMSDFAGQIFFAWEGEEGGDAPLKQMSENWSLEQVVLYALDGSEMAAISDVAASPGGVAQGALSPQVAALISWSIPISYRGGHPRTYMPGCPGQIVDTSGGRTWQAGYLTSLNSAFTAFQTACNGAIGGGSTTAQLGMVSYTKGKEPRATPIFYPFGVPTAKSRLCTQRRRLGKQGA